MTETTALVRFEAAKRALAEARSIDEVKLVRDQAEALRLYVRQQGESLELQNDIAEIKLRAERRAGELLAGMEKHPAGRPPQNPFDDQRDSLPTLDDLGISYFQSHRWQAEASMPEEQFEQHIAKVKAAGDELTSVGLYRLAQEIKDGQARPHISYASGNNEWYTPAEYIERARAVMGAIDLDPASSQEANSVVGASEYFTINDDGLHHQWHGRVWLNPPYASGLVEQFTAKLMADFLNGDVCQAIVLVNNATETAWFQSIAAMAAAICFPSSRIRFWGPDGQTGAPLQGQAVLYLGSTRVRFGDAFAQKGLILWPR